MPTVAKVPGNECDGDVDENLLRLMLGWGNTRVELVLDMLLYLFGVAFLGHLTLQLGRFGTLGGATFLVSSLGDGLGVDAGRHFALMNREAS